MRGTVADTTFDLTASIQSRTGAADGQGGEADTWAEAVSVACCVLPKASYGDKLEGGRQASDARWIVRVPYGTAVTARQRIVVGSVTYEVLAVDAGKSNPLNTDCECKTIT
jgi:head-tail adaptor